MRLEYEPAWEALHISARWWFASSARPWSIRALATIHCRIALHISVKQTRGAFDMARFGSLHPNHTKEAENTVFGVWDLFLSVPATEQRVWCFFVWHTKLQTPNARSLKQQHRAGAWSCSSRARNHQAQTLTKPKPLTGPLSGGRPNPQTLKPKPKPQTINPKLSPNLSPSQDCCLVAAPNPKL
jgi:hypothetical protein